MNIPVRERLVVIFCAATLLFVCVYPSPSAQIVKPAPNLADTTYNTPHDSIGANHQPVEAVKHLECLFVACKPKNPELRDVTTIYYDPAIEFVSITATVNLNDLIVTVRRGKQMETFFLNVPSKQPYRWIQLEPQALRAVAARVTARK